MAGLDDKSPFVDAVQKRLSTSPSWETTKADADLTGLDLVIGVSVEDQPTADLLPDLGR